MRPLLQIRTDHQGQALVEFALVLPLVLLLLVGILEFGRAWNEHQVVTDAAREAVRTAALADPTITAATVQAVVNRALNNAGIDSVPVILDPADPNAPEGTAVTAEIRVPYRFVLLGPLMDFMGWAPDQQVMLKARATMRKE